jgi:uncharacterized membrane protein
VAKKKVKRVTPKRNGRNHRIPYDASLTFGQKAADKLTLWAGSWTFIIGLGLFMAVWIALNIYMMRNEWDPYPFILLNFVLSTLAAIQAPIILMSQNREVERDRHYNKYDYQVNRKAEREIQRMQKDVDVIKRMLQELKRQ